MTTITTARVPRFQAWLEHRPVMRGALTIAGSAFLVLALLWMFSSTVAPSHKVEAIDDAGLLLTARSISTPDDVTEVETTKGTFLVSGAISAVKGNPVTLEKRRNGQRYLCDRTIPMCKRLVR
jgi:hypothetical protein